MELKVNEAQMSGGRPLRPHNAADTIIIIIIIIREIITSELI